MYRGEPPSGVHGAFWINSAETYHGPLGIQDPAAPPVYELTGILRSRAFAISGGHIALAVGGGADPDSLYVALVDATTGDIITRATGNDSNLLSPRNWNVSAHSGLEVYIEIVDLRADAPHGYIAVDDIREGPGSGVGVADTGSPRLTGPRLGAPFPNPLAAGATVPLTLEHPGPVRLTVYDVHGRRLRLLHDAPLPAGRHRIPWDGRTDGGQPLAAGVYFLRLESDGTAASRKLMIAP
jgi:hypothetical protein